ncbi:MAG: N-6 DNA methylase, partial [Planctomycetes bacterium]|nr:N-6 DNA methylase [Planctomycetota bacterium]
MSADFSASALYAMIAQDVPDNVLGDMSATTSDVDLGDIATYLRQPSAIGLRLDSAVLLAHVSSRLFQEAHLDLERQGFFLGMSPELSGKPKSSEIRYTPVNLARLLVQTALRSWSGPRDPRLLDPACGSGAFLLEAVNEIARSYPDLNPSLSGLDVSAPAVAIAHMSVRQAAELLRQANVDVRCLNALEEDWPPADIVVMNPPFRAWKDMDADDRDRVAQVTGSKRRNDKSLAFLHKAWETLRPGGILTSVLPAPLLLSDGMAELQSKFETGGEVLLIGRLEGYTYFTNAIVETAFIVVRKTAPSSESMTRFALGTRDHEDEAIREIRMNQGEGTTKVAEIYTVAQNKLTETGWLPRPRRLVELLDWARRSALPSVSDTFNVHQGVRTGLKAAFVLSYEECLALPKKEQTFFRPAAGQGSIHSGVLTRPLYVFYPYSGAGTTIETEDALLESVP